MVLLQPVHGVRDEERLHLALAEVEDAGRPVGVLVHERVFQLIAAGAVEFIKAVLVLREVGRDPVEQHADAGLVALVHKAHELLRLAVAERRSIVARDLIAPRRLIGIFGQRHELDVGVAHVLQVGHELICQLVVGIEAAARLAPPRAEVHLIDVHRAVEQLTLALLAAVVGIAPGIAVQRTDTARRVGQRTVAEGIGIGFIDGGAVAAADIEFIGVALARIGGKGLPDAVFDERHRQVLGVPEVPVAGHADALRPRGPDTENIAVDSVALCGMAAQEGIGAQLVAERETFECIMQRLFHGDLLLCSACGDTGSPDRGSAPFQSSVHAYYTTLHKNFNCPEKFLARLSVFPAMLFFCRLSAHCTPFWPQNMRKNGGFPGQRRIFPARRT